MSQKLNKGILPLKEKIRLLSTVLLFLEYGYLGFSFEIAR